MKDNYFKIIKQQDFEPVYKLLELSFPPDERRHYCGQLELLNDEKYRIYARLSDDRLAGFLSVWDFNKHAYIEHFAVAPEYRNIGLGSEILGKLLNYLGKPVCLEVEKPENEIARRRIGFYKRNGFFLNEYPYIQPAFSADKKSLPLFIMTSGKPITREEFENVKTTLYKQVYKVKD